MFTVETTPNSTIIHVADDLDLSTRSTLRKMIAQAELSPLRVIVSLLSCTYVDASCLGALITSRVRIGPRFFVVMNIDTVLGKIFKLCLVGRDPSFIVPTIAAAEHNSLMAS